MRGCLAVPLIVFLFALVIITFISGVITTETIVLAIFTANILFDLLFFGGKMDREHKQSEAQEKALKDEIANWKIRVSYLESENKRLSGVIDEYETIINKAKYIYSREKNEIQNFDRQTLDFLLPDKNFISKKYVNSFESKSELVEYHDFLTTRLNTILKMQREFRANDNLYRICSSEADMIRCKLIADTIDEKNNFDEIYPAAARVSAEIKTLYLEAVAKSLDWGKNISRKAKVESIRTLRREAKEKIEIAESYHFQLEYLCGLFPNLKEYLYFDLDKGELKNDSANGNLHGDDTDEEDEVRDYLSDEEYRTLSETERNQLALDRYMESRKKSKWQIGRDYELYIGYLCEKRGFAVQYTGNELKLEDLGRDLILSSAEEIIIIQCKCWAKEKVIREKHIMQLFGTVMEYKLSNNPMLPVRGVFVTSTTYSDKARHFADVLEIELYENVSGGEYPRIKCNVGKNGKQIYHLPIDLSYDVTKIKNPGECMAFTCAEAEALGFRRSYRWHGIK